MLYMTLSTAPWHDASYLQHDKDLDLEQASVQKGQPIQGLLQHHLIKMVT